jgi:hypothetical protein
MCLYVSLIPSIPKTFIQKVHNLITGFYVPCLLLFTCVTFSLVLLLLFYILRLFLRFFSFFSLQIGWEAPQVKHLQTKVLKALQQKLTRPSPSYMPLYHPRWKFDSNDDTVIFHKQRQGE